MALLALLLPTLAYAQPEHAGGLGAEQPVRPEEDRTDIRQARVSERVEASLRPPELGADHGQREAGTGGGPSRHLSTRGSPTRFW